ncbi:hypothetical protein IW261DRAFT_1557552 [Armillaria novae-zelandiae]|uniref:Uncharacterized protein n=1 Tax=Armillaria novae-zelandiae TaxID=153914 RepID=A0AA39PSP7_9AGAR|nr:hypothetical protein IW261DRAFT_1557552 [Armillaria novae-zelandiae]
MQNYATVDARKEWVQVQLANRRFLYANPDATEDSEEGCGAFRSRIAYGNPAAGLALAAAAVKQGLTLWKDAYDSYILEDTNPPPPGRNSEYSFKDNPWGTAASKYYVRTSTLSDEKWRIILNEAVSYISKNRKSKTGVTLGGEMGQQGSLGAGDNIYDSDDDIVMLDW